MLPVSIPSASDLTELTEHRDDASVTIYLRSSPYPQDTASIQLSLRNAVADAVAQLEGIGIPAQKVAALRRSLADLDGDREFWEHQARALVVFAAPGTVRCYRLANQVTDLVAVGDRFDVGPLLRSVTFANSGHVLTVSEGGIHLYELNADSRPIELDLPDLPDDLHTVLEHASNYGQADMPRAAGASGQKIEQHRYCRLAQDAVLHRIGHSSLPLILAASDDLEPAYRDINTHAGLLDRGIDAHPNSLTLDELASRARAILDEHYRRDLHEWRENFGTQRSNGRATTKLKEVARAATAAAVAELHFDIDSTLEGSIDDMGVLHRADAAGPTTYNVVDEIAARVLRSGGTVRAVRNEDLLDGSPVAAVLRFPV